MKLPKEIIDRYETVKSQGDGKKLMKILGYKSHTTVSLILSGEADTTIGTISKIKRFVDNREKQISKLIGND